MNKEVKEVHPSYLAGRRWSIIKFLELRWIHVGTYEPSGLVLQQKVWVSIHGDPDLNVEFYGNKYIDACVVVWMDVPTV